MDTGFEISEGTNLPVTKYIGLKDQSTLAFNIILHVIFLKLNLEVSRMACPAGLTILLTIVGNYTLILIFSSPAVGRLLDPNLIGVG